MKEKLLIVFLLIFIYIFFKQEKIFNNNFKELNDALFQINAYNVALKKEFNLKEEEITAIKQEKKKFAINFTALTGTDCSRCHLSENLLFPINNKMLEYKEFRKFVREGTKNMPSYIDRPNKGIKDITDSELRRIYEILKQINNI